MRAGWLASVSTRMSIVDPRETRQAGSSPYGLQPRLCLGRRLVLDDARPRSRAFGQQDWIFAAFAVVRLQGPQNNRILRHGHPQALAIAVATRFARNDAACRARQQPSQNEREGIV